MKLHFNVIIPTRDRADTLIHCLRTIVAQDYDRLRIIVSDNNSVDETRDVAHSFDDSRIHYINTGNRLSMSKNWEFALSSVDDGWVTYLGDDDGLLPWALETLDELIREYNVEAVSSRFASFIWPGHFAEQTGHFAIPRPASPRIKDTASQLTKVFNGEVPYHTLPWLYHGGCASIELINRSRHADGHFFCSQIPDVYSAIAIAHMTTRFLRIEKPIAINGASKHSTGTSAMKGSFATSKTSPFQRFQSEENIPFHESLVFGKSLQMLVYESYLQSWHLHGGELGISLKHQLGVAVAIEKTSRLDEVRRQCDDIAKKNAIEYQVYSPSMLTRAGKSVRAIRQLTKTVSRKPRQIGISDVFEATQSAEGLCRVPVFVNVLHKLVGVVARKISRFSRLVGSKLGA